MTAIYHRESPHASCRFRPSEDSHNHKNNITAFYSAASPYSNFYPAKIKAQDGRVFHSSEQKYHVDYAEYVKDDITAAAIYHTKTPFEAYKASRYIKGLDDSNWYSSGKAKDEMYNTCLMTFSQNPNIKAFLLATKNSKMVEASWYNKKWGVGLSFSNEAVFDTQHWNGENWMVKQAIKGT